MPNHLKVQVNHELLLDAGTFEKLQGRHGAEIVIRPPAKTLFHQVLDYLREKPDPPKPLSGSMIGREGVAAAAVALRWGSYFAVLADRNKATWSKVNSEGNSRIDDDEMARINVEGSAALAEWIDIFRAEPDGRYTQLVNRAVFYLPMPKRTSTHAPSPFTIIANPERAAQMAKAINTSHQSLERVRKDCEASPTRVFANALFNTAWRNGPIENIHAGSCSGYPLDLRRITQAEERKLMDVASRGFANGMWVCLEFKAEQPLRRWPEQVFPYAWFPLIAPSGWTLSESSREIRLAVYS